MRAEGCGGKVNIFIILVARFGFLFLKGATGCCILWKQKKIIQRGLYFQLHILKLMLTFIKHTYENLDRPKKST